MAVENREWLSEIGGLNLNMVLIITSIWDKINESVIWQHAFFFTLCALFATLSLIALAQLIRIEWRVPEYKWTLQKVFHLMNFIVNAVRAIVFGFHKQVFTLSPKALVLVLLDLPGLLFFSTYTLLVLFWAEIYHQAKFNEPADKLKLVYLSLNAGIYVIQVGIWIFLGLSDNEIVEIVGRIFIAVVSLVAAISFVFYGQRLFAMLKQFPIESRGRTKKLYEVGSVAAVCSICFLIRCIVVLTSACNKDASLDVLNHPILDFCYYTFVEILPSALVLFILRKLPPKRAAPSAESESASVC